MAPRSLCSKFLALLERVRDLDAHVTAIQIGSAKTHFEQLGWIRPDGYLTHVLVPFFDSDQEVEVDIDEDAGCFYYVSPQHRNRRISQPLAEIVLYQIRVDAWLDCLTGLAGIAILPRAGQRQCLANHLWYLGDIRVASTNTFAPLLIGRHWESAHNQQITTGLCDSIWPEGGILLLQHVDGRQPSGAHIARKLDDFVFDQDCRPAFDQAAMQRVLHGHITINDESEPVQFLEGNRLKLPHFVAPRDLAAEIAKIIKQSWGVDGQKPPVVKWVDINAIANTGYSSFDDAFREDRDIFFNKVSHGKYQLRRNT